MLAKRKTIFIIFGVLLIYIIAALVWWFLLLQRQNTELTQKNIMQLHYQIDSVQQPIPFSLAKKEIAYKQQSRTRIYIAEGLTFLALILLGATWVWRLVKKQFLVAKQQQNFMLAVTHELKTPIAIAQLNLQTLKKHQLNAQQQQKLLDNTLIETNRLDQLASNILISSQLDSGAYAIQQEEVAVDDLVQTQMQQFASQYASHTFTTTIKEECTLIGDAFLLQILINNLLSNAVKYSPSQTNITATVTKNGFTIVDEGFGIAEANRKKVFEKFVRLGNENTRATKGTGLGLYLCKKIAQDHKASIELLPNNPTGTIAAFKL
jgi:two-component system, OmpR family, sensor histidine kinase CiaH